MSENPTNQKIFDELKKVNANIQELNKQLDSLTTWLKALARSVESFSKKQ